MKEYTNIRQLILGFLLQFRVYVEGSLNGSLLYLQYNGHQNPILISKAPTLPTMTEEHTV